MNFIHNISKDKEYGNNEPFAFGDSIEGIAYDFVDEEEFIIAFDKMFPDSLQKPLSANMVDVCSVYYGEWENESMFFAYSNKLFVEDKFPDAIFIGNYFCFFC